MPKCKLLIQKSSDFHHATIILAENTRCHFTSHNWRFCDFIMVQSICLLVPLHSQPCSKIPMCLRLHGPSAYKAFGISRQSSCWNCFPDPIINNVLCFSSTVASQPSLSDWTSSLFKVLLCMLWTRHAGTSKIQDSCHTSDHTVYSVHLQAKKEPIHPTKLMSEKILQTLDWMSFGALCVVSRLNLDFQLKQNPILANDSSSEYLYLKPQIPTSTSRHHSGILTAIKHYHQHFPNGHILIKNNPPMHQKTRKSRLSSHQP